MKILMVGMILAANMVFAAETIDYKTLYLQAKNQCEMAQTTLSEADKQLVATQSALTNVETELAVQNQSLEKQRRIYDRATENAKETGDAVDNKLQQTYTAAVNAQKAAQTAVNQRKQALQQAQAAQQQRTIDLQTAATQGKTATIDWLKAQFEILKTQEVHEEVSCNDEQTRKQCKDAAYMILRKSMKSLQFGVLLHPLSRFLFSGILESILTEESNVELSERETKYPQQVNHAVSFNAIKKSCTRFIL